MEELYKSACAIDNFITSVEDEITVLGTENIFSTGPVIKKLAWCKNLKIIEGISKVWILLFGSPWLLRCSTRSETVGSAFYIHTPHAALTLCTPIAIYFSAVTHNLHALSCICAALSRSKRDASAGLQPLVSHPRQVAEVVVVFSFLF